MVPAPNGTRSALVRKARLGVFAVVERTHENGTRDLFTLHKNRADAREAAYLYELTGEIVGLRL